LAERDDAPARGADACFGAAESSCVARASDGDEEDANSSVCVVSAAGVAILASVVAAVVVIAGVGGACEAGVVKWGVLSDLKPVRGMVVAKAGAGAGAGAGAVAATVAVVPSACEAHGMRWGALSEPMLSMWVTGAAGEACAIRAKT
jgi:hypothetical protein